MFELVSERTGRVWSLRSGLLGAIIDLNPFCMFWGVDGPLLSVFFFDRGGHRRRPYSSPYIRIRIEISIFVDVRSLLGWLLNLTRPPFALQAPQNAD